MNTFETLKAEAINRGVWNNPNTTVIIEGLFRNRPIYVVRYDQYYDVLWDEYGRVYTKGKWIEPLEKTLKEETLKTEIDWSKFPKTTQEKVGYSDTKQETAEEQIEQRIRDINVDTGFRLSKQETLQEASKRILANNIDGLREVLQDDDLFFFYKGVIECYGEAMAKWMGEKILKKQKTSTQTVLQEILDTLENDWSSPQPYIDLVRSKLEK